MSATMRSLRAPIALWLFIALGFVVACGFAAAFDRFPGDLWLAQRLQDIEAQELARSVDWAEDLVDTPIIIVVWGLAVATLLVAARRWEAFLLLAAVPLRLINAGVKEIVDRPRPAADLIEVSEYPSSQAFPSGHANGVIIVYGLLLYFSAEIPSLPLRLVAQGACIWIIVFTGLERVFVGAHWPSDVLGGYYLGGLVLTALIALRRLRRPAPPAQPASVTDSDEVR